MEWIKASDRLPDAGVRVLVVKYYLNREFDPNTGGYDGKPYQTAPGVEFDRIFRVNTWAGGGTVTHWMMLPELPENTSQEISDRLR